MPEGSRETPQVLTETRAQPQENSVDKRRSVFSRVKRWGGRATLFMSAAALATACTSSSSTASHETYKGKPQATYSAPEIPGLPNQHSVTETFNTLRMDPNIPKNGGFIDIKPLANQFKASDFVPITSIDPRTKAENPIDSGSAPLMEVRYNKTTGSFTYQVQTPHGLDNQELYQLLLPVIQNQTLLQAAFANNDVTRVVIRLEAPALAGTPADYTSDEYVQEDWSSPKEGMQKSVFLYLPDVHRIDTQEIRDTLRHEAIHGLTGRDSLSENPEAPATPNPEELKHWNQACVELRDFSLQDAEKHKQRAIIQMEELGNQLHNPAVTEILTQIIGALRNGTFDRYQPKQGENPNDAFTGKVPDCITIGPWGVFVRLMNANGMHSLVEKLFTYNKVGDIAAALHDDWQSMTEFQTIYSVLREGTYEQNSQEKLLGHEFDNWDELVTSVSDVAIAYPKRVAASIKALSPDRRAVVLRLVNLALTTLNAQVPMDRNPSFHALVTNRLTTINEAA